MENNANDNNVNNNNNNNNEILGGLPARRRVRDFDLNKEPIPSPEVSGNDDCHSKMGEIEEVQSKEVVVQTAMEGVEEVQSDHVPVVQTEPSKDKGKRPMVFAEEADHKVDDGGSAVIEENTNIADADQSGQHERKRQCLDSIDICERKIKVIIEVQEEPLQDGYRWRKYGQKNIKGNKNQPRAYYRCSDKKCLIRKQVELDGGNPRFVVITYEGRHNHGPPIPMNNKNAAAAAAKNAASRSRSNRNDNNIPHVDTYNAAFAGAQNAILNGIINRNYNNIPPMLHHHYWYHTYEHGSSSNGSSAYRSPAVPLLPMPPPVAAAVNLNGGHTSCAPAEDSNKVTKNNDDDKQKDI